MHKKTPVAPLARRPPHCILRTAPGSKCRLSWTRTRHEASKRKLDGGVAQSTSSLRLGARRRNGIDRGQAMRPGMAVWITGIGAVTPLGHGWDAIARNLLAGRSGVRRVTRFDVAQHPCQIAGLIEHIPCPPGIDDAVF